MIKKVTIIGSGFVGSTLAYTLMLLNTCNEIVIIDKNKDKAIGDALDMNHGMSFLNPINIYSGEYKDIKNSQVVVITAGVAQKENETRTDLLKRNIVVFDSIIGEMKEHITKDTIILVVTNPVDVLSYYTYKKLNIDASKVIGSGTVLDTARLKYVISEETNIDQRNVHTFVCGEHGDSEVSCLSATTIGGVSIHDFCEQCGNCKTKNCSELQKLGKSIKNSAYEIIEKKGATYYAVALAVNKIIDTILNDSKSVLTVSSLIKDKYDINDVYLSLPTIVSKRGVIKVLEPNYSKEEIELIKKSAQIIKSNIAEIM